MAGAVRLWLGAIALVLATPVSAESVKMTGKFAAKARDVAMLRSLSIERFAGRDGQALSLALERALSTGRPPHFRLVFGRNSDAEGIVSGAVSTSVDQSDYRKKEKRCAERVDKKCVREVIDQIRCTRRLIELRADIRVAEVRAGRIAFSDPLSRRDETSWCGDESGPGSADGVVRGMIDDIANELAGVFAPRVEQYSVRFRESTKGLTKDQQKPFKAAVKATKTDLTAACAGWAAIDRASPNHPSVLFDLGLCAEAAGDYEGAEALYSRAAALISGGGEGETGMLRIADLMAARADDAARNRRR